MTLPTCKDLNLPIGKLLIYWSSTESELSFKPTKKTMLTSLPVSLLEKSCQEFEKGFES